MKKLLAVVLTLCLAVSAVFALTACTMKIGGKTFVYDEWKTSDTITEDEREQIEQMAELYSSSSAVFYENNEFKIMNGNMVMTGTWRQDGKKIYLEINGSAVFSECGVDGDRIYAVMGAEGLRFTVYFKQA